MRILLTGSRTWNKIGPIAMLMLGMKDATFILGDNPNGLDALAKKVAEDNTLQHIVCKADWGQYGDKAGPLRNGVMVSHKPDVAFAFRMEGASPGTDDCTRQCFFAGVPVYRVMPITEKTEGIFHFSGTKGQKYNSEVQG